jgi:hypothetical protein
VDRRCAMTSVVRPARSARQRLLHQRLVLRIQRARRLVQQQHARVAQQRAGQRDALALAAGEPRARVPERRRVALRQQRDEVMRGGGAGGRLHLRRRRARGRPQAMLAWAVSSKSTASWPDIGDGVAQAASVTPRDRRPSIGCARRSRRTAAGTRASAVDLPGAGGPDQRHGPARLGDEAQAPQRRIGTPS